MKFPTPLLLHLSSLGLVVFIGLAVTEMVPLYSAKTQNDAQQEGMVLAKGHLAIGRGQGPTSESWTYGGAMATWWAGFRQVNLVGKLPPPPPPPPGQSPEELEAPKPVAQLRPLEEVIELVSLVYDGKAEGKGGATHVIVRFKPEANVEPPEWWIRENTPVQPQARPSDGVPSRPGAGSRPGSPPTTQSAGRPSATPPRGVSGAMPLSVAGGEKVQKVWAEADDKDPRRSSVLWPIKAADGREVGVVRLVRVAQDAQSAFFVREPVGQQESAGVREEELIKTTMNIPQDVLAEMRRLQGKSAPVSQESGGDVMPRSSEGRWIDQMETTRSGNRVNIGREDETRLRESSDELFAQLDVDTYVSKSSGLKGVYIRSAEPQLAARFGVASGDVLLEVNGRKVESKAQAIQTGKSDYNRGVRSFVTKWLTSSGQVVERVYQAPDR